MGNLCSKKDETGFEREHEVRSSSLVTLQRRYLQQETEGCARPFAHQQRSRLKTDQSDFSHLVDHVSPSSPLFSNRAEARKRTRNEGCKNQGSCPPTTKPFAIQLTQRPTRNKHRQLLHWQKPKTPPPDTSANTSSCNFVDNDDEIV